MDNATYIDGHQPSPELQFPGVFRCSRMNWGDDILAALGMLARHIADRSDWSRHYALEQLKLMAFEDVMLLYTREGWVRLAIWVTGQPDDTAPKFLPTMH